MVFLSLRVFKRSGQICVVPKARDVGSPVLDHTSSHKSCTKLWPVGFLKSQLKLCTHRDDRAQVAAHIIERFRFQGSPQSLINALESVDVTAPLPPSRRVGGESNDGSRRLFTLFCNLVSGVRCRDSWVQLIRSFCVICVVKEPISTSASASDAEAGACSHCQAFTGR